MGSYTTEEEITVSAEIDLEISVQDQDGNEIDCDIDGYGFSLTAQIDTQSIKDNMLDEVREEIKDELRDELRDELQEELQNEFKDQLCKEIANADNPIQVLSGMLSLIAIEHDKVNNVMNEAISNANTRLANQSEEIQTLQCSVASKEGAIDSQNQVIQKLQVRLDEGSEAKIKALQTLEEAREEASAASGPLSIIAEYNANSQEDK